MQSEDKPPYDLQVCVPSAVAPDVESQREQRRFGRRMELSIQIILEGRLMRSVRE